MVQRAGNVVKAGVKKSDTMIHLHDLIHDSDHPRRALSAEITEARRTDLGLAVEVTVETVGSGHKEPTGIPSRLISPLVEVEEGVQIPTRARRHQRIVADERGRPQRSDSRALPNGARILNDARIAPREKRIERFISRLSRSREMKVSATLTCRFSAPILRDEELEIELGKALRVVR